MHKLSLPSFDVRLQKAEDKTLIYDIIRKKYVVLTPEEWVRQHFVHYLITALGYPKSLISVETGMKYHDLAKRTDIIIYNRTGEPLVLVECKSSTTNLNQKVMEQALMYNRTIKASYIILTNGLKNSCIQIKSGNQSVEFLATLPMFEDIVA
jgi:hypothetical protein